MTEQTLSQYLKSVSETLGAHNGTLAIFRDCINELAHENHTMKAEINALRKEIQFLRSEVLKRV